MPFIALISEQEQELAGNMLLYFKASIDGLLATIVHLRSENQNFQKENMTLTLLNNALQADYDYHKNQLIKVRQLALQHQELTQGLPNPMLHQEMLQNQQNQAHQHQEQQAHEQAQLLQQEQAILRQQQEQAQMQQQAQVHQAEQLQHMNFAGHYGNVALPQEGGYTHQANMVEIDAAK